VLLVGERGTGKELAARRLHYLSARWNQPLVTLNCAALSPTLIESELFGYEAGAFTGAVGRRAGRFEAADGGTLFLDEIGNIPLEVQEKILRVVEYGVFERVGSARGVAVDVRILGATNADLDSLAQAGRFKRDLLDRLSFEVLFVPPLRERNDDILLLARHFATRMGRELGREEPPEFSPDGVRALRGYGWPGNVRELKNVVERAVYRADTSPIEEIDFDPFRSPWEAAPQPEEPQPEPATQQANQTAEPLPDATLHEAVRDLEIRMLRQSLERARFNQKQAAELLGLTYHQFRGLYRKYKDDLQ
jgi:psp operon transcriptional activator